MNYDYNQNRTFAVIFRCKLISPENIVPLDDAPPEIGTQLRDHARRDERLISLKLIILRLGPSRKGIVDFEKKPIAENRHRGHYAQTTPEEFSSASPLHARRGSLTRATLMIINCNNDSR